MQSRLDTPIDDQHLTRRPHPRPAATMVTLAPLHLCLGNQPAEVPRRPGIAGRPGLRQQPLRRDPPRRLLHPLLHQIPHLVEIAFPTRPHRQPTGLIRLDDPAHRLVGGAADLRGPPIAAHVSIGGDHIHPIPRVLQWRSPSAAPVTGFDTVTVSRGRASTTTTRRTKSGDFHWPPAGTSTWPPVGTFSWPRTTARKVRRLRRWLSQSALIDQGAGSAGRAARVLPRVRAAPRGCVPGSAGGQLD